MTVIRPSVSDDIDDLVQIDRLSSPDPWSANRFSSELQLPHSHLFTAVAGSVVRGFICAWIAADELEIHNLAVAPGFRGQGIGYALVEHILNNLPYRRAFLEVRESNRVARTLYAKFFFSELFVRKGYYSDGENGIIMALDRSPEAAETIGEK